MMAPGKPQTARGAPRAPRVARPDAPATPEPPAVRRGRRPRDIGTAAETAVVRYLRAHGWPEAERRQLRGNLDAGDITGTPGICWEIKGGNAAKTASDGLVTQWLADTERERINAGARLGILVMQRAGYGPDRCYMWWAVIPLHVLVDMLPGEFFPDFYPEWPVRMHLGNLVQLMKVGM